MTEFNDNYLAAMGVTVWRARGSPGGACADTLPTHAPLVDEAANAVEPVASASTSDSTDLPEIERQVAVCRKCGLAEGRINTVFGVGNARAEWMIVGEAPGAEEDRRGEPFVGRAGQLLNAMIATLGIGREDVYIANVLKCRPPNNRDPLGVEVSECLPYLLGQIRIVRPRMILALGRFAAQALLQTNTPISRLRGNLYHFGEFGTPLVVSYHPAYLLRSPLEKRKAWLDLKFARRSMEDAPT